jgi:hypothetical protein
MPVLEGQQQVWTAVPWRVNTAPDPFGAALELCVTVTGLYGRAFSGLTARRLAPLILQRWISCTD